MQWNWLEIRLNFVTESATAMYGVWGLLARDRHEVFGISGVFL
jgi:hypothetical protein